MPLASSQNSTAKASKQRVSLPLTIDSSTKVTKSKAMKRRASLRSKRDPSPARSRGKENEPTSPGPTPYWKVAEERDLSPRLTRSASKKKPRLPPFAITKKSNGVVLMFSPPDQEANRRREQEKTELKEQEIANRVADAKANGHLQIFSPNAKHSSWWPEEKTGKPADEDDDQVCLQLSPSGGEVGKKSQGTVDQSNVHSGQIAKELNELKKARETMESMNKLLKAKSKESPPAVSEELLQMEKKIVEEKSMQNQQLLMANAKLEATNERLHDELKGLETKLASEKESFLVEKTRLQGEIEASHRENFVKIQGLEESRKQLANELKSVQHDKTAATIRVAELENELNIVQDKIQQLKRTIENLQTENQREKESLSLEGEQLAGENEELSAELEAVMKARDDLKSKLAEKESALDSYMNQLLPESEHQLKALLEELRAQKMATNEAEAKLGETIALIEKMEAAIKALESEKENERLQFQKLNEESSKAFAKMIDEAASKAEKIDSLTSELARVREGLADEKARSAQLEMEWKGIKQGMDECVDELERSSQQLEQKLERSEQEKESMEKRLDAAMNKISELLDAKKNVQAEYSTKSATLEEIEATLEEEREITKRLQDEGHDRQLRINELEKRLKAALEERDDARHERDDARNRMDSFDSREEDLYRKLREGDRIRRDLHNRVMQLSGNIRVYVRVRPALPGELEKVNESFGNPKGSRKRKVDHIIEEENPFHFPGVYDRPLTSSSEKALLSADDLTKNIVEVTEPYKDRGGLSDRRKKWRFGFDHVFSPEQGQDDVWEATEPLVQSAIDGYNVCVFAYGQTGSGKTYTMIGEPSNEGLITRSVSKLFDAKHEMEALSRGETKVSLSVELLEIYNEQVRDLLAPDSGPSGREVNLKVTSSEVVGNIVVPTTTKDEVMHVLDVAQKRRCVKATMSNAESSRSHMLFTIHFNSETKDGVSRAGKLHICDLAGSERLNKSGAHSVAGGSLLKETQHINSSLSVLSNVIERLQEGSSNVPYRESKLTFLLQNSLGGNSKTLAIVCCNPLSAHFHESLCSLRFASKVNKVDLKAVENFIC